MFTAVRLGKTTFEELSSSLFNVVPIAAAVGVGFEEVTAALSAMTAQGTPTTVATTQLRQLILALTAPTVRQVKALDELGLEFNRVTLAEKGLAGATKELISILGGNDQLLKRVLGSTEALQAALILGGAGAGKFAGDLQAMAKSTGAADTAFQEMEKSTSRRMARLQVNVETAMIKIGNVLLPMVDILASVPPEALAAAAAIAVITVAALALTAALPFVIAGVTALAGALGALALPVLIASLATAGVAFLIFRDKTASAADEIERIVEQTSMLEKVAPAATALSRVAENIRDLEATRPAADQLALIRRRLVGLEGSTVAAQALATVRKELDSLQEQVSVADVLARINDELDEMAGKAQATRIKGFADEVKNLARGYSGLEKAVDTAGKVIVSGLTSGLVKFTGEAEVVQAKIADVARAMVAAGATSSELATAMLSLEGANRNVFQSAIDLAQVTDLQSATAASAERDFSRMGRSMSNAEGEARRLSAALVEQNKRLEETRKAARDADRALASMTARGIAEQLVIAGRELDRRGTEAGQADIGGFLRFGEGLFEQAEAAATIQEQINEVMEQLTGATGLGALEESASTAATAIERAADAFERWEAGRLSETVEAFMKSGETGVKKLRGEFARLDSEWESKILPGLRRLGVEVPEEFRAMYDRIGRETEQGASNIGGLLGVLLTRRLSQGLDPGAGLLAAAEGGTLGRRDATRDTGATTVVFEGDLVIGSDSSLTQADVGQAVGGAPQRSRLREQRAAG